MKTKPLLHSLIACASVVALVLALMDFSGMDQAWQRLQQARQSSAQVASQLAEVHGLVQRNRALLEQSLQTAAPQDAPLAELEANIQRISTHWASTLPLLKETNEAWLASAVAMQRMQYLQKGLLPAVQALRAHGSAPPVRPLAAQALSLYAPLDKSLGQLRYYESERALSSRHAAEAHWQAALQDFALLAALLLLLLLLLPRLLHGLLPRSVA